MLVIVVTNCAILIIVTKSAKKTGSNVKRTYFALAAISGAFVISYTPYNMITFGFERSDWFDLYIAYSPSINTATTPIITFITINKFRRQVLGMFLPASTDTDNQP